MSISRRPIRRPSHQWEPVALVLLVLIEASIILSFY